MYKCGFTAEGVITEVRELKTKDLTKVWAHQVSIASLGITVEVRVTELMYGKLAAGLEVTCHGRFELYNGKIQLIANTIDELASSPSAPVTKPIKAA